MLKTLDPNLSVIIRGKDLSQVQKYIDAKQLVTLQIGQTSESQSENEYLGTVFIGVSFVKEQTPSSIILQGDQIQVPDNDNIDILQRLTLDMKGSLVFDLN